MQNNLWEIDLFNINGILLFMRCVLRTLMQTPIMGNSQRDEDTNNYDANSAINYTIICMRRIFLLIEKLENRELHRFF